MGAALKIQPNYDGKVHIVPLPAVLDKTASKDFEAAMGQWLINPATLHVLDFSAAQNIETSYFQVVGVYRRNLLKAGKTLVSVNMKDVILRKVTMAGLVETFNPVETLDKAIEMAGVELNVAKKGALPIDSNVLNFFVEGTISALSIQANVPVTAGSPFIKKTAIPGVEIAGLISMNNPTMPGSIAICFPKNVFLGIYENMVGEKHTEITQEIQDGASELLNIIYGQAKAKMKEQGVKLEMAIPVVLVGDRLRMQVGEPGRSMILPFNCSYGSFHMEVYFKKIQS